MPHNTRMLLAVAIFGLIVPNGLFIYWLFQESSEDPRRRVSRLPIGRGPLKHQST